MKTIIIAEAGVNHNGSIDLAKQLVDVAKEAGADYVKFQTFKAKSLSTQSAEKANYQKNNNTNESHFEMLKKLELNHKSHKEIISYCEKVKIKFLSTGFDIDSINMLVDLKIPLIKIPSGEITNLPYLRHVGKMKKPIIMSTGMSTMDEVNQALKVLNDAGTNLDDITVLQCNTEYPTPPEHVNLNSMLAIKDKLSVKVGYSDHTTGIDIPIAAVAMGATIIEKHFTINRSLPGPDHQASLEPVELKNMIASIRRIERAMGIRNKMPTPSELKNIKIARKSIVAKKKISKGEIFTEENLCTKRPGTGISPMQWYDVLNKKSKYNFKEDELIKL